MAIPRSSFGVNAVLSVLVTAMITGFVPPFQAQEESQWNRLVRLAKERGTKVVSRRIAQPPLDLTAPADQVLAKDSLLVVRPVRLSARQGLDETYIVTWHLFEQEQVLVSRPAAPDASCSIGSLVDPPTVSSGQILVRALGGTVQLDGVTITETGPDTGIPWQGGQRYLVVATICPGGRLVLRHATNDVFRLDGNSVVVASDNAARFAMQLAKLRTLGSIEDYVRKLK